MTSFDRAHPHGRLSPGKLALSIPDLRFEQSYLLSLQRFIHHDDAQECFIARTDAKIANSARKGEKLTKEKSIDMAGKSSGTEAGFYGVPLRLDWGGILYVTIRNQILSPFAQGAALLVLTLYLRPFLRTLGGRIRKHVIRSWRSTFPPLEPHIQVGTGWMRKQLREFSVGGVGANIALGKH
ncbi:hypothetical protein JB92DRAFT_3018286 [Gautieria morchelliformis]|nr:hypothetical protein JB92DRAFT_3018286 [Gautieria morchelliformis]